MKSAEEGSRPPEQTGADDYYNNVFERLSETAGLLESAVAYALYKNAKKEWIHEFRKENGRRPRLIPLSQACLNVVFWAD
jgi:hypothetical protein